MNSVKKENPVRAILVLRPGALGDVLLTTPALRALRRAFPSARISIIVTAAGKAVLKGNQSIDEIIVLDKSSMRSQASVIPLVRRKKFDVIIDFLCNPRTALITLLSGAPRRVGYDVRMRKIAYSIRKQRDKYVGGKKLVEYAAQVNNNMLRCLGIDYTDTALDLGIDGEARARMDEFLRSCGLEGKGFVGICPAGTWPAKTWAVEKFAALADLIQKELGLKVLILWGPGEKELAERMAQLMISKGIIACETSIEEVSAVIKRCALLVSNDSGLKHIAVALGTPTVTIFGPTNPGTWNPPRPEHRAVYAEIDCLFCDKNSCGDMRCMKELDAERVFSAIKETLEAARPDTLEATQSD